MCISICNVYLCSIFFINKDKIMTKIFIFTHFGQNINYPFLDFVTLKGCLYRREIILAVMLKQLAK